MKTYLATQERRAVRPLGWLGVFGFCLALAACAPDGGAEAANSGLLSDPYRLPSAGPAPEIKAVDTVLRVHYPIYASGHRLSVRGSLAPLDWGRGITMDRTSDTVYEYRVRGLTAPLEWKPLLDDATWSRGSNYRAAPGETVDVYPHFYNGRGTWSRRYPVFHSYILGNDRGVWVYLPPSYNENKDSSGWPLSCYPVLYMHDGQNLFDPRAAFGGVTWRVPETLDAGIDALPEGQHLPEVIVIGPENTRDRIWEYTPTDGGYGGGGGDKYLRFLAEELKPEMDRTFHTCPQAAATTLAGSSLGGLISAYAGLKQPAVFGRLGIFSPSTWWDERYIIGQVLMSAGAASKPLRVYVDSGDSGPSNDDVVNTRALAAAYRTLGYRDGSDLLYVVQAGGQHSETYWAQRLPGALRFLLQGL